MLNSMTGYGRYEQIDETKKIVIDIRSVNHRYSDVTVKLPRAYGYLEDKIREYVLENISRGKVDVFIYIENYTSDDKAVILDESLCMNYYSLLNQIKEKCGIKQEIAVSDMTRFSDIFVTKQQEEDKEEVWQMFLSCLKPAMEDFLSMRKREGERLFNDLKEKAGKIQELTAKIEEISPKVVAEYAHKLEERMKELLGEFKADEGRILTEVGIMADRVCINEELVRLKSHFVELDDILAQDEPVGRKLDFLVQELNRETNTIGSKANDKDITKLVVEIKSEIEKLREQIQNVE
ncbi:MAG: YicC family protein [Clostridia bacterium]|nr:YicC family protein [Clostridia bacterium]